MREARLGPEASRSRISPGEGRDAVSVEVRSGRRLLAIGIECVTGMTDNGPKASCTPAGK
ncbi:hypothetical protein GCM10010372_34590 [Streptomyces tauricus]|nr:hypothetical protein GCM10010372_34590 [Streptomyces tauricus]